jgi:hypothetical protein
MAKRFTDTDKWKDNWYISLPNDYKIIWQWLLDNCTHTGLCKRSVALLNLMCKVNFTEEDILEKMEGRIIVLNDYWFIPNFLKFQYSTLNSAKPAIVSVVKDLFKYNLIPIIPKSFGNDYIIISKSFDNHYQMIKDKDKDKDKDINTLHNQVRLIGEEKKIKNENEIPPHERDGLITAAKRREIAERFKAEYPERFNQNSQS